MAANVVKFMLEKLEQMLNTEEKILEGELSGLSDMRDELENMRSILREADAGKDGESIRSWVKQIREVAYDVEDVLDDLMLHFGKHQGNGPSCLGETLHSIRHLGTRRRIASEIQRVRTRLHNISMKRDRYAANSIDEETPANATRYRTQHHHVASLHSEEDDLVGIEKRTEDLLGLMMGSESELKVISVVGKGGLGKTALARCIYNKVKQRFTCHAWISVTQSFEMEELLRSTMSQLFQEMNEQGNEQLPPQVDAMEDIQLIELLHRYLRDKRYVIILDDVWDSDACNSFRYAFPDNNIGSRILITTRSSHVAYSFSGSSGHTYNLQPLSEEEAWILFSQKAFRFFPRGVGPLQFRDVCKDMVQMCSGLPLVIQAIGGLLSKKGKTLSEWENVRDNLQLELSKNRKLDGSINILLLSYYDLPSYIKCCLLYFSIYPKNYSIKRITLIRLWVAEGFIEIKPGKTVEEIAEDYLNELIDRNMVQVADFYEYGRMRSCCVHNLIQEVIELKCDEENFGTVLKRENKQVSRAIRRLSFHSASEDALQNVSSTQLRALFMFEPNALTISSMRTFLFGFRFLKVLDLEGALIDTFPTEVVNLHHLRYLSLRNTKVEKLSKSLGKLKNLATLDLKGTYISELPSNILKLKGLRHLLAYHYYTARHPLFYNTSGVKVPKGIGSLTELQKLSYLEANPDSDVLKELGNLTQLKRLGIVKLRKEDGKVLCSSIEKMVNLLSFSVTSIGIDEQLEIQCLQSPPPFLQRLYLRGPLQTLPHWLASLQYLVRLRLRWSRLGEDSLSPLQKLPNLLELTLFRAYDGVKLCCEKGGFQKLKILTLDLLDNLSYVALDGAMPHLQKMCISSCQKLETVPSGIEKLIHLKELHLFSMPEAFMRGLKHGEADYPKFKNISIVRCYHNHDKLNEVI